MTSPARPTRAAALLAAAITVTAFCAADALARSYPFGPRTRSVNDLGNQYVPFHAHLWDLLHGRADGGLLVNWQSGYGASFLPDLGTYVSSPFAPLVAVFPRDEIDLAVYVITVLKTASAGAAMACLLLALRPGRWWAAGLLGASYALCGWSVAVASYNPMWLDGLVALPLLCLVGEWTLRGRRPLLGVLVVALAWIANFYTAYMATLGAGLVLLLRLWLSDLTVRRRLLAAGRAVATVALGVGLAAPLVAVVYFGTKHAHPGRVVDFAPVPTEDLLARLLPTTYTFGSPALYVGTAALLLALALPFHRAVPRRVRAGWTLLVVVVTLSFQWGPTHLLWHAFATPQGSPYRQTFVLCALLVIAAWHALSYGPPDLRALGAAGGLLAVIATVAGRSPIAQHTVTWAVLLLAVVGALGGLALLCRADGGQRTVLAGLAVALLLGGQFGEAVATSAAATRLRYGHLDDYAPWGARQQRQAEVIAQADGWPRYRTDPGRDQTVANDPLLVGGQGAQYYSSLTSDVLSRTLTALGGGWTSRGRSLQSLDNAVTDVAFSVGARVHSPPDPHQNWFPQNGERLTVTRQDVPPLVTVRPSGASRASFGPSPYRNQELLLGTRVYTVPRITVRTSTGKPPSGGATGLLIGAPTPASTRKPTITAQCPPGDEVYLWAPHFNGAARLDDGPTGRFRSDGDGKKIAAMQRLGAVPPSGRLRIELAPDRAGRVPEGAVGCLDTDRLHTAAERLKATGATRVSVSGATLRAELPAGSTGIAVVAAPRIAGWRCATGDATAVPATEYHGLIAVPLDGSSTSVTCTFHPPGLRLGMTVGGASLLTLILLGAAAAVRRRRLAPPPASQSTTTRPRERVTGAR
ncbi:YfhO family protein [Streptomyces sp. NBC_00124]|uniref:YfhO family protein n=1 Tax=Streptomyces sp. NBC_00124 TaxID=2975662 RepID=UPI0022588CCD|nr:YfhO family protein [Streptomyces sp. NBC_00124]MCX5364996.1 YfhO family protein [Streptomyces sp. NBC_00124]